MNTLEKPDLMIPQVQRAEWTSFTGRLFVHAFFIIALVMILAVVFYSFYTYLLTHTLTAYTAGQFTGAVLIRLAVWIWTYRIVLLSKRKLRSGIMATPVLSISLVQPQAAFIGTLIMYFVNKNEK